MQWAMTHLELAVAGWARRCQPVPLTFFLLCETWMLWLALNRFVVLITLLLCWCFQQVLLSFCCFQRRLASCYSRSLMNISTVRVDEATGVSTRRLLFQGSSRSNIWLIFYSCFVVVTSFDLLIPNFEFASHHEHGRTQCTSRSILIFS